jgi:hypothetical protein
MTDLRRDRWNDWQKRRSGLGWTAETGGETSCVIVLPPAHTAAIDRQRFCPR